MYDLHLLARAHAATDPMAPPERRERRQCRASLRLRASALGFGSRDQPVRCVSSPQTLDFFLRPTTGLTDEVVRPEQLSIAPSDDGRVALGYEYRF